MATVPQPYVYPIANIPGAGEGFTGSEHLKSLIQAALPDFFDPTGVNSDGVNVSVTGTRDLTTAEKTTLDGLVARSEEFFIVTTDGGVTDLPEPGEVSLTAGLLSSKMLTLQLKDGNGNNQPIAGGAIKLTAPPALDKTTGAFDANGKFVFTASAQLNKGSIAVLIESDSLPPRNVTFRWN